jgi:hypothetical protein
MDVCMYLYRRTNDRVSYFFKGRENVRFWMGLGVFLCDIRTRSEVITPKKKIVRIR